VGVAGLILLIGLPILLFLGILSMRRDSKRGGSRGTAARVMRAGLLETQGLLEPEKKVEILKQEKHEDVLVVLDPSGGPPRPEGPKKK
jgi:hypothetical protein